MSLGLNDVHTAPPGHDINTTTMQVYVPLSVLEANGNGARTYSVYGITHCDEVMNIGRDNYNAVSELVTGRHISLQNQPSQY